MKIGLKITKKLVLFITGLIALAGIVIAIVSWHGTVANKDIDYYFTGRTEDGAILVKWQIPAKDATLKIIHMDSGEIPERIEKIEKVNGVGTYVFTGGIHGDSYIFKLQYVNYDGDEADKTFNQVFLYFDKLPALTTFFIETEDGADPSYKHIRQDGMFGLTITDKNYKRAVLNDNIPVKIRVRGNSSTYGRKKSYKLVFDEQTDLLNMGEEYADQEWLLLGKLPLETYLGLQLGMHVGMEWEPRVRFVNLMLNGQWRGMYVLCESIKKHPKRVALDQDGFLIESDGYFWNENGIYFGSDMLSDIVKFTFKYPEITSTSDARFIEIENWVRQIDDYINQHSHDIGDLIDFDTFTAWILAHELMGTSDGFGSNMFFYRKNMAPASKLKMGPLWDFDSMFDNDDDKHSAFWSYDSTYFPLLINNPIFMNHYKNKYLAVVSSVEKNLRDDLEKLANIPGFEESYNIERGNLRNPDFLKDTIDGLMMRLHNRITWLNSEMEKL